MKNREKYREEIVRSAKTSSGYDACEFKRTHVLPHFGGDGEGCNSYSCKWCYILCGLWLDEEYEVDWNKVPVYTLVRVRDYETDNWKLRYFAGFFEYDSLKYATWNSGRTSKTAEGTDDFMNWRFCELVEDEDNGK